MSCEKVKLGEVVDFIGGSQPTKTKFEFKKNDTNIRLIQIRDYKSEDNITYIPIQSTNKFCSKDDIMIGRYGPPVFQILRGLEGSYNVALMKAKPTEQIDNNYLYYFLKQKVLFDLINSLSQRTAGQSGVDMKALKNYPILLHPINVQKRIVEVLDKAQELIDLREEQIRLLDNLVQSIFYNMFGDPVKNPKGWNSKKIIEIVDIKSGGTPSRAVPAYFDGDIPWITTTALGKRYINSTEANEYITKKAVKESATKIIPKSSLLIGIRVGVGKVSINNCDLCTNQDIIGLVNIKPIINNDFLRFLIISYNDLLKSQQRGSTIKGITSQVIKELNIICPPIELQNEFADRVQKIEEQKELMQKSLAEMRNNYNSLMQRAFKGALFKEKQTVN